MTIDTKQRKAGKAYAEANNLGFSIDFWEKRLATAENEEDCATAELAKSEIKALKILYRKAIAKYHKYAN